MQNTKNWFNKNIEEVEQELNTKKDNGLSKDEAENRIEQYGLNELKEQKPKSIWVKLLEQFKDFMIIVLIIAAIISGVVGYVQGEGITDSIIIMIVVIANAIIGVAQENKAEKSLKSLKKLSSHTSKVIREGNVVVLQSRELVPGDLVVLETGDYVPADIRLTEAINLKVQESSLTGESIPVEKNTMTIESKKISIGDRTNMVFSSSLVTYGRGKGIVVETGMNTEVGNIANILNNTEKLETPLQIKLNQFGKTLGIASITICIIIFIIGLLYGKDPLAMFMTAVSLAVAVIPEGLAAVSTIVLAIGVQRMIKKHAIVKKMSAVETLGSATVICSDKTGTLTQNKMTVLKLFYNDKIQKLEDIDTNDNSDELKKLIYTSVLCNDTEIGENDTLTGDPTETALVDMSFKLNFSPYLFEQMPRVNEIPFDSNRKLMTTVNKESDNKYIVYTKGGIDELLNVCNKYLTNGEIKDDIDSYKNNIYKYNNNMAEDALRVLAMGYKEIDHLPSQEEMKTIENNLIYIGMVGMIDPPREEARMAVEKCKAAGIKTVMITGDHKTTAVAIAKQLGILNEGEEAVTGNDIENMSQQELEERVENIRVYARVSPEHKVRIVKAWQSHGEIVAMTGDGVNDAPALKTANIGCAMGKVGTDVAKEASDVILTDDNFATVVSAVEEGRRIYDNILKAIQFLLSSNVGEVILLFVCILIVPILSKQFNIDVNLIVPLLPIHILWINLVTDSFPALALAFDPANKDIMNRKPLRTGTGIFTKDMIWRIAYQGIMIGILSIIAFILGLTTETSDVMKVKIGQTMAFIVLAFAELIHIFNIRDNEKSIFSTGIGGNSKLFLALAISSFLMIIILIIPTFRDIFSIQILSIDKIMETLILIVAPIIIVEIFKALKINKTKF